MPGDALIAGVESTREVRTGASLADGVEALVHAIRSESRVVASHTATWNTMAAELHSMAEDLRSSLSRDLPDWRGLASAAHQNMMSHNVEALGGLGAASAATALATEAAGNLVSFTRDIVRDLIADLVARVVVWAGRILTYITALVTSPTNLSRLLNG